MRTPIPVLIATALVAIPAAAGWAATHSAADAGHLAASKATATPSATPGKKGATLSNKGANATATPTRKTRTSSHKRVKPTPVPATRTVQGPSVDMRWGPVQVTLIVKGKRITDVQASAPTERARSAFINDQAIPMLRQEVLQAQSSNINSISGATMTSDAFYTSLQAALQQAHLA
ncbi:MAG TPA: FMN-binding protein [Chloroflexota bacterium]|nr:FMN-binding protein [Chloroflexota bacterium]